jgi:hypothetical protein
MVVNEMMKDNEYLYNSNDKGFELLGLVLEKVQTIAHLQYIFSLA